MIDPPVVDILGVVGKTPWFPVQLGARRIHAARVVNHVERRCRCDGGSGRPFSYALVCGGFRGPEDIRLESDDPGFPMVVNCMRCRTRLREIAAELDRSLERLRNIQADVVRWLGGEPEGDAR